MPNGTSDPVEEARYAYDRVQRDIGFDPGDPRLQADGTYKEADRLFAALEAALTQRAQQPLLDLLRELEWRGNDDDHYCLLCFNGPRVGHTPDCRLGTILKQLEG